MKGLKRNDRNKSVVMKVYVKRMYANLDKKRQRGLRLSAGELGFVKPGLSDFEFPLFSPLYEEEFSFIPQTNSNSFHHASYF